MRKDEGFDIDEVLQRWDSASDLAKYGVAFLTIKDFRFAVATSMAPDFKVTVEGQDRANHTSTGCVPWVRNF